MMMPLTSIRLIELIEKMEAVTCGSISYRLGTRATNRHPSASDTETMGDERLRSIRSDTSKEYFHRFRSGDVLRPDTRLEPVPPQSPGSIGYFQPAP
ncbi:hypothetical protein [Nocardia sp. NPDC047648]